jgi:dihydrodipicolinate synthase/N-acetylneuraminate lyase
MKPLQSHEISGTWGTVLLPVREDESIDFTKLAAAIDTLIASGVSGIYTNGTAGEFYNQTEAEFDSISMMVAEKCHSKGMPFQIGCNHMSPVLSLERLKRTKALAPGAIQVILPDWFPPAMPEIINYLRVMEQTAYPVGLVLYNPPHAKKKLTPQDFYEISKAGINLVGCKVSGGDEQWYTQMKSMVPQLSLFVPGHHLATGVKNGAHGSYSNVACINPAAAQNWYKLMLTDMDKALEFQDRIQLFLRNSIFPLITEEKFGDAAIDKFLASITGWSDTGTRMRWPYRSVEESKIAAVRAACRQILPEFFEV